jgi:hypothetical protein
MCGVIAMAKSSAARNHRNNPYVLDRAFVRVHHSAAGTLFRFRTELATLTAATTGGWELATALTLTWAMVILATTATAVTVLPWTRRFIIRRAWCVLSRHRIQKVCYDRQTPAPSARPHQRGARARQRATHGRHRRPRIGVNRSLTFAAADVLPGAPGRIRTRDPLLRRCRTVVRCSLLPGEIAHKRLIAGHVIQPCWCRLWVSQTAPVVAWL